MLKRFTEFLVALGPWGILLIALLDSGGIPLAAGVDALIILLAIQNPEQTLLNVTVAVLGSTAGNIFLYTVARKGGERFLRDREQGPKSRRFEAWFHHYGLLTVFVPAIIPIPMPLKAFVILSGVYKISRVWFIATILVARILRYGGEAYLGVRLGADAGPFLVRHRWELMGASALLFLLLYVGTRLMAPKEAR
ncbi:MAG: VTT domain-containing protein [Bryobacterales bacterium]|nr:VTT domain-containing protein [Bryobacterales bacterium]